VCLVVAAVLVAAADAVFIAHHLPIRGAHLVTALTPLHVQNLARRNSLEAGNTREKKGGGAKTLSQQVINNSTALRQERGRIF
jgi:hypothetical protein